MASEFVSKVELHWPDGKVESWSSVRVLRVNTKLGDEPIEYVTVTLVEGKQNADTGTTS